MKRFLVAIVIAVPLLGQETKKVDSTEAMMEMYIEMAKPVPEHQKLGELSGRWTMTSKLWFNPAEPPRVASGTATGRLILGGRFLHLDSSVKGGAISADSVTILGFDRRSNDYTMIGLDTLGTYYITAAGKYDDAAKGIVLDGSYAMPPTGQDQKYRFTWRTDSPGEHVLLLHFDVPGGKPMLVAETTLKRAR
jgi:hypothetical protein